MVDRVVGRQMASTVEAVCAEDVFEWFPDDRQRGAFAAEQVTRNVWHVRIEEFVHAPNVVDPHDFQGRLEQSGETGKSMCDTGAQFDRVPVCPQR